MKLGHTNIYAETNNGKTYDDSFMDDGVFYTKLSNSKRKTVVLIVLDDCFMMIPLYHLQYNKLGVSNVKYTVNT